MQHAGAPPCTGYSDISQRGPYPPAANSPSLAHSSWRQEPWEVPIAGPGRAPLIGPLRGETTTLLNRPCSMVGPTSGDGTLVLNRPCSTTDIVGPVSGDATFELNRPCTMVLPVVGPVRGEATFVLKRPLCSIAGPTTIVGRATVGPTRGDATFWLKRPTLTPPPLRSSEPTLESTLPQSASVGADEGDSPESGDRSPSRAPPPPGIAMALDVARGGRVRRGGCVPRWSVLGIVESARASSARCQVASELSSKSGMIFGDSTHCPKRRCSRHGGGHGSEMERSRTSDMSWGAVSALTKRGGSIPRPNDPPKPPRELGVGMFIASPGVPCTHDCGRSSPFLSGSVSKASCSVVRNETISTTASSRGARITFRRSSHEPCCLFS
mmetsp:Transcript_44215/g.105289  ORF Transcript_44215/g.105289 Transcript_44215/m.105289 type:complete len:382 (+) Transcript_44215:61-1206(+)